jgi:hypothetical protein
LQVTVSGVSELHLSSPATSAVHDEPLGSLSARKVIIDSIFDIVIPTLPPQVTAEAPAWAL